MFKRILIPTDGSDITTKAVDTALGLARALGGRIDAIASRSRFPTARSRRCSRRRRRSSSTPRSGSRTSGSRPWSSACQECEVPCEGFTVEALHPWEAIIDHARTHQCDLIVMASHGRRGVTALLLGSETQKVLTHSTIPVLVVR